jgi:aryl-alcohol dehydrogenase-like predicted oxidoreductase
MEPVRLGTTGLKVSPVCLGMMSFGDSSWRDWVLDEDASEPLIRAAIEAGITFFDTANMYSVGRSEEVTGKMLRKYFARREDYVIATKVYMPMGKGPNDRGLSRGHIMDAVDASLRRLGVDHIDLYQIHRYDSEAPIEETMEALHDCVRAGKVRYLGASSMYAWQFAKAQHTARVNGWTPFVTMQNHYNLLYREEEREMIPQCIDMGVGILPWSPLARGKLARPADAETDSTRAGSDHLHDKLYGTANRAIIDAVGEVAAELGVSRAEVGLAWIMQRPGVTSPIVGTTKMQHLEDAVGATKVALSEDQVRRLEEGYTARPVLGL